jgi:hypothetical protein
LALVLLAIFLAHVFRRPRPTFAEAVLALGSTGISAAIIIPNFVRARAYSSPSACVANLKQIQGAKETWALERNKTPTDVPTDSDLFGPTVYIREKPSCPAGGTYVVGTVGEKPRCSLGGQGHTPD